MKKIVTLLILAIGIFVFPMVRVEAAYNYTPWNDVVESAEAMTVSHVIDNSNLVDVNHNRAPILLGDLRDIKYYENKIYISDASLNKIIILNDNYEYLGVFPTLEEDTHKLNTPQGIFLFDGKIYISDTNNFRLAVFDLQTEELVLEVKAPESEDLFKTLPFRPTKVVVDRTGRMNLIVQDVFEGIMEFDETGVFARYFGTKRLQLSFFESILYAVASKSQKAKMALKLQTSFTSIDIDDYGYVYAVSRLDGSEPVKKINFKGRDILRKTGYVPIVGDSNIQNVNKDVPQGSSTIIDVTVNDSNNRYSVLDNNRNRIFTYDNEGYLLYISGAKGIQSNKLEAPTSLTYQNNKILVTDNGSKSILVFDETPFGAVVNEATELYYDMDYENSKVLWEEVLRQNSNYFLAYARIGKVYLRDGDYQRALENLKLGHDRTNYSYAYEQYRNEKMANILPYVLVVGIIVLGYAVVKSLIASVKREQEGE